MKFDLTYIYGPPTINDPYWVLASLIWASIIAGVAWRRGWDTWLQRVTGAGLVVGLLYVAPVTVNLISHVIQLFAVNGGASFCIISPVSWLAAPFAGLLFVLRAKWKAMDVWVAMAWALIALSVTRAGYVLLFYPREVLEYSDREPTWPVLWLAPLFALAGAAMVVGIHRIVGDRGRATGARAFFSGRLQIIVAWLAYLLQSHAVNVATFPSLLDMDRVSWPGVALLACVFLAASAFFAARRSPKPLANPAA